MGGILEESFFVSICMCMGIDVSFDCTKLEGTSPQAFQIWINQQAGA